MSKSDWLKLLAIVVFISVLVECPYVLAQWHPPTGYAFRGSFWSPHDLSQYFSAAYEGAENGSWLIYDKLTPEEHSPAFIFPLYVLLGHFASQFHLQVEQTYHVLLILSRIYLILAIYWFVSAFIPRASWWRFGTLTVVLSAGFGGWLAMAGAMLERQAVPTAFLADLKVVEMNTFIVFFSYPHLMLALGTLLVCTRVWLAYLGDGRHIWLASLYIAIIALGLLNPFSLLPLLLVLSGHALIMWIRRYQHRPRLALGLGLALLICVPFIAYNYFTFSRDAFWGVVYGTQNSLPSPGAWGLISGFGIAGVVAIFGFWVCLTKPSSERLFLIAAFSTLCLLMYLPVPYQRRFGFGLHPIVICLALVAIQDVVSGLRARTEAGEPSGEPNSRRFAILATEAVLLGFLAVFTNSFLYLYVNITATTPITFDDRQPDVFEPIGLVSARNWLRIEDDPGQIVLSHHRSGNFLAASIPGRVFTGHRTATKDFEEKNEAVQQFFSVDTPDSWRRQLLLDYNITHVVYGPWERELGPFDPASSDYLRLAYSDGDVSVFRVLPISPETIA